MKPVYKLSFYFLLVVSFFCSSVMGFCQDATPEIYNCEHKLGFSIGYGDQKVNLVGLGIDLQVDYTYKIIFTQINYIYSFLNNNQWDLGISLQSEYGITTFKSNQNDLKNSKSYEFGISAGLILSYKVIREKLKLYSLIATGPHYSEESPQRQISGFMFNSNFDLGIIVLIKNNLNLDFRTGFRHLSNANLRSPNFGINNLIFTIGLLYQIYN
ncbi:MAG: acyloxyacyl hydrolase [Ignavibacterium sp.]|nr:acyloxyacyl hydrolase [Ignavibacterium sp.]MCX7610817.1 acyloxyacyl hydrolase [Ignavibacterium sp.]MDW8374361.1 acyloxyacyl hydrolase [Ignavibacteriales bacterium]